MKPSLLPRIVLLGLALFLCGFSANAQQSFFEPAARLRVSIPAAQQIQKSSLFLLKDPELRVYLAKAPLEFQTNGAAALNLVIPLPNGKAETFSMLESPILAPAIAAQHPEIKTYTGRGVLHPGYTVRLSFTGSGFDAIILGVDGDAVYYTKVSTDPTDRLYMAYFARDAQRPKPARAFGQIGKCGTEAASMLPRQPVNTDNRARKGSTQNNTGATLRTFRLAMAADGEFTQQTAFGGDVNLAYAAVVGYVNRVNAVYRRELSVAFTLVSDVSLVYSNTATDPYTDADMGMTLDQNQTNIDLVIGSANYDIGHVLGSNSGGGVVSGRVCNDGNKARGTTGPGFGPDPYGDQVLCHEIGHQFGMNHSYNSNLGGCTTRNPATTVEPGSGATIMSYDYICSDGPNTDDYEQPAQFLLNFHTVSFDEAEELLATVSCYTSSPLSNAVPVVALLPANATIPKSTPFALTGVASDVNGGDVLTYSWEGTNIGTTVPVVSTLDDPAQPPFFRTYEPISTGTRTFPRLAAILDGTNQGKGDKLPSVGIVTTHVLTIRDNVGGVTHSGVVNVTIAGNSGPFLETTNLAGSYAGNSSQTITWDVANTTNAPVSCANVDILLSTDGGQTFPTTLLANTPNDGTQSVTLPNVTTSTARIKVAGSNTIFFDISNTNFTITAAALPVELVYFRAEPAVDQVRLSWATASERNSDRFTVERSQDLSEFGSIGSLPAAGESVQVLSYGLNDDQPLMGTSYYRLVQRDRDGQTHTSKPVSVRLDPTASLLLVSPNPAVANRIRYRLLNMAAPQISLMTLTGTPVAIQSVTDEGSGSYLLRSAVSLPVGIYVLRAESESAQLTQRVLILE